MNSGKKLIPCGRKRKMKDFEGKIVGYDPETYRVASGLQTSN